MGLTWVQFQHPIWTPEQDSYMRGEPGVMLEHHQRWPTIKVKPTKDICLSIPNRFWPPISVLKLYNIELHGGARCLANSHCCTSGLNSSLYRSLNFLYYFFLFSLFFHFSNIYKCSELLASWQGSLLERPGRLYGCQGWDVACVGHVQDNH